MRIARLIFEDLFQQASHDVEPFRIKSLPAHGLARPAIPIRSVVLITFLAVQVGVNPRTVTALILLSALVGPRPSAFGVPTTLRRGRM
jgi:hypothetical protein